jgi:DNA-binding MarR family transcriptional regulator
MGGTPRTPALAAWLPLLEAHSVITDALERDLQREHGIALGWLEVLIFLGDEEDGRMRMQDLADRVLLSKSGVTRLVDRMEDAGLVSRASCRDDRRVTYAVITPAGAATATRAAPALVQGIDTHLGAHLSATELRTLRSLLLKVVAGHGRASRECPSMPQPARARTASH